MDENEKLVPVYVNECGELDFLKIPGVGLQLAHKLAARRQQEPLSAPIMADIMGSSTEWESVTKFDTPARTKNTPEGMSPAIELVDARNRAFSGPKLDRDRSEERGGRSQFVPPPKTLIYAGEHDWSSFRLKFDRFCTHMRYTKQERVDYMCWTLKGKAAEYYTLLLQQNKRISYDELIDMMKARFAVHQLREVAMLEFRNALQRPSESLQEWGERLSTLAVHAFGSGMGARETDEIVSQFCTGLLDKQAGLQVANRLPESVPEAIRFVLRFQHSRDRIYGASSSQSPAVRLSRQQSPSPYREREQDPRASRGDSFPRRDYVSTYRRSREEESPVRGYDDQEYRNRLRERDSWRRAEPRNVYYRSPSPQPRDRSYVSTYRRSREEESPVRGYDDQEYRQRLRERDSWRHAEPRNVYYRSPSPQPRDRSLPQFGGDRLPSRQSREEERPAASLEAVISLLGRLDAKVDALSNKVERDVDRLEGRMARVERGRSPDPDRRGSSPRAPRNISPEVICHGCSRPGHMVAQCPDKRVRFNDSKNVQGPSMLPRSRSPE